MTKKEASLPLPETSLQLPETSLQLPETSSQLPETNLQYRKQVYSHRKLIYSYRKQVYSYRKQIYSYRKPVYSYRNRKLWIKKWLNKYRAVVSEATFFVCNPVEERIEFLKISFTYNYGSHCTLFLIVLRTIFCFVMNSDFLIPTSFHVSDLSYFKLWNLLA